MNEQPKKKFIVYTQELLTLRKEIEAEDWEEAYRLIEANGIPYDIKNVSDSEDFAVVSIYDEDGYEVYSV